MNTNLDFLHSHKFELGMISSLLVLLFGVFLVFFVLRAPQGKVLFTMTDNSSVSVSVTINSCDLEIITHPEKRIPLINNWQTRVEAEFYDLSNNYLATVIGISDSFGVARFDVCAENIFLPPGDYNIWLKGLSHLRKDFGTNEAFDTVEVTLDFVPQGTLLAGETSVIFDNYINVLDVSSQITNYLSSIDLYDLNQDGQVNVLDITNTITNLYMSGECSPRDILLGFCPF